MDGVFAWVAAHGYGALFLLMALGVVGLPIPDETILVFAGYLIGRGTLHPAGAFFAALAGAWTGISGSYLLGRTLGVGVVHRYGKYIHFTEARLANVHRWFDRIGHWMLVVGYYIAGAALHCRSRWNVEAGIPHVYGLRVDRRSAMGRHIFDVGILSGRKLETHRRINPQLHSLCVGGTHRDGDPRVLRVEKAR